jgi:hypothetical protein
MQIQTYPNIINYISDDDVYIINSNNLLTNSSVKKNSDFINNKSDIINNESNFINKKSDIINNESNIIDNESNIINNNKIQHFDKINDRYNRKLNYNPNEYELIQFLDNKNLINENNMNNEPLNNQDYLDNDNSIDFKIFSKSNKSQKLFKDSKTIASRFTKNSIIDDYKSELDYYEKLRTPWWVDNN